MNSISRRFKQLVAILLISILSFAGSAESITLISPGGAEVFIARDGYGVPHITSDTDEGVFFGQGFAIARDRLTQMERLWRSSMGCYSEVFGLEYLEYDREMRMYGYTTAEYVEIFEAASLEVQTMLSAYTDGVNTYMDSMDTNPEEYAHYQFADMDLEPWTVIKTIAIIARPGHRWGLDGGMELVRLQELQEHGEEWFEENRPINDPSAPTTISNAALRGQKTYHYSGMKVRKEVVDNWVEHRKRIDELHDQLNISTKFGSFGVLISEQRSATGGAMMLGAPQMGEPELNDPNTLCEVELDCNIGHFGGVSIPGVPGVIIGRNEHFAWTMTSGGSDNMDVYIDSTEDDSYGRYWHNGEWLDFEVVVDTIYKSDGRQEYYTHYRTVHGPVFLDDLENHQVFSLKTVSWLQGLSQTHAYYNALQTEDADGFFAALEQAPLTFNVMYADDSGTLMYWHTGLYQDRSDGVDPRLPHKGDGSEEWGGFIPFYELPHADETDQDYFVNWNNKPVSWWDNGDNVGWIGVNRVTNMIDWVEQFDQFTFENLKHTPQAILAHGTWQQAIDWANPQTAACLLPPGQSYFFNLDNEPSPHNQDQWYLHVGWDYKVWLFDQEYRVVEDPPVTESPNRFRIEALYPNPFNPALNVVVNLPNTMDIRIVMFNLLGNEVGTITEGRFLHGRHQFRYNTSSLASGVYFVRAGGQGESSEVRKVLLLK